MLEKLFEKIIIQRIDGDYKFSEKINYEIKTNDAKFVGIKKKMDCITINSNHLTYEDSLQEVAVLILEVFNELGWSEERFTNAWLDKGDNNDAKMIVGYLKTRRTSRVSEINNYKKKKACENILGTPVRETNIADLRKGDSEDEDMSDETILDHALHNNNEYLIDEVKDESLTNWIQENKDVLSKVELQYLINPASTNPKTRKQTQNRIEKKMQKKSLEQFGTTNARLVKAILERNVVNSILDSEDVQREIVNNNEFIVSLDGYYDLDHSVMKDINKGITDSSHKAQDLSLVAICNLLFKKLDKLESILKYHKIDDKLEKEVVKKAKFKLIDIPNIVLDFDVYSKNWINNKGKSVSNKQYERFQIMHKSAFNGECTIDSEFYTWSKFYEFLKEEAPNDNEVYNIYFLKKENEYSGENCIMLPRPISNFIVDTKPSYLKGEDVYFAEVGFQGKRIKLAYNRPYEELQELINEWKTKKLKELVEIHRDSISNSTAEFLESFKFDIR